MSEASTIPGYTLHRVLGRGNTSLVRLATNPQGQLVALKLPLPETLAAQDAAERFGNEVRLTLQFRHPHLVRGFEGTPFGPNAFLALTYYPQGALNEQLARLPGRSLPLDSALRILADVASALTYLHRQGAVHQDVKPQNVYVTEDGRAALADLGNTYFVAQGGKTSGSPFYMAPEVYQGEATSSASDVYSMGVMLYELLSGDRPFHGTTYEELMMAHLTRFVPPLVHLNPQVPRSVARLAELALAKRPADRPGADQLRRALLGALGESPDEAVVEEDVKPVAEAGRPVGRHGAGPLRPAAPEPAPTVPPEKVGAEKGGRNWNPFRRRK
ncbi:serine/threonine protein kinase [Deinococcus arenae]|uniref:Serine/threonine protein kinase n=1 Tax=Deinococcus arenae TaxID=1452751 RepID=A0A8H9L9J4_9DEIO|nr:serine/threonine-protein kinase [Deinococcus arenae]AWT34132.1 serine/threonine protein kinase [Deinococcus actinosclerus]GGM50415.1 serine/threonine protein kinase [Deinococcus arenae]